MAINSKELAIILLGLIGSSIFAIFIFQKGFGLNNLQSFEWLILFLVAIIAIVVIMTRRIGEVGSELDDQKKIINKLGERLKMHEQLTNLEARIIALEKGDKNG